MVLFTKLLWFKISKNVLAFKFDLFFGCIDTHPENSKYANADAFDEIENELNCLINAEKCYVALVGDFNSKTGILSDYTIPDDAILQLFDVDSDSEIPECKCTVLNNVPLQRDFTQNYANLTIYIMLTQELDHIKILSKERDC